jgi:hypothetical protein
MRAAVPVFGYKSHRTLTDGTGNPDLDRDRRHRARHPQIDVLSTLAESLVV